MKRQHFIVITPTVWKFHDFSVIQILREINSAIVAIFRLKKVQKLMKKNQNSEPLSV